MIRYSSTGIRNSGRDAINEFKLLVKEAHKRGIEVIASCNMIEHLFLQIDILPFRICLCRLLWMLFSITQLKEMRKVPFFLSEVLIIVSITCLHLRYCSSNYSEFVSAF